MTRTALMSSPMIVAGLTGNGEILKQTKRLSPALLVGGLLNNVVVFGRCEKNNARITSRIDLVRDRLKWLVCNDYTVNCAGI